MKGAVNQLVTEPVESLPAAATTLNRARILEAAMTSLDQHGPGGFTMRRLATDLGVSAPTLYWHFRGREELLAALLDDAFATLDRQPAPGIPWRAALRSILGEAWNLGRRHPGVLPLLPTAPPYPHAAQLMVQRILLILRHAGFAPKEAVTNTRVLVWTTFGFMRAADPSVAKRAESGSPGAVRTRVYLELGELAPGDVALIAECVPALSEVDLDALYSEALEMLLTSMAKQLRAIRRRHG